MKNYKIISANQISDNKFEFTLYCNIHNLKYTIIGNYKYCKFKCSQSSCGCPLCNSIYGKENRKQYKLDLLTKYDLESMSWTVILDLIGIYKLPSEFNKLCKYGENTPERKKMIQDLIDSYNIEVSEDEVEEETNEDIINNENIETEVNNINDEDTNIYDDENEELNPFKELKDIGELLGDVDEQFFSTGDKFIHLFNKSMHQLWNRVLRDNENHNENTINEIHQKLINNSLTKYEKYIYEEFMKEYDEVINMEIH